MAESTTGWPDELVLLIVPEAPGGATDTLARALADRLEGALGQPVIIQNNAGASGAVGAALVAEAKSDGYTIMIGHNLTDYGNAADFQPIVQLADAIQIYRMSTPNVTTYEWFGLFAPAGTPAGIVGFLNETVNTILADPAFEPQYGAHRGGNHEDGTLVVVDEPFPLAGGSVEQFEAVFGGTPSDPAGDTTGTAGDDLLAGSGADDTVLATSGSDTIDGAAGDDAVVYDGARAGFSHQLQADGTIIVAKPGGSTDTLTSIERVSFEDGDLLYNVAGVDAAAAYRLYGGAFDRVPDEAGFRFWADAVTGGTTLEQAAAGFIASDEFIALYGGNLNNAQFVDQLYLNVLGRSGEDGGVIFWNDYLDGGGDRAVTLVNFTQLPEYVGISEADIENGYWVV